MCCFQKIRTIRTQSSIYTLRSTIIHKVASSITERFQSPFFLCCGRNQMDQFQNSFTFSSFRHCHLGFRQTASRVYIYYIKHASVLKLLTRLLVCLLPLFKQTFDVISIIQSTQYVLVEGVLLELIKHFLFQYPNHILNRSRFFDNLRQEKSKYFHLGSK